ncbi:unnamed protein product [Prorocentrum cordatum]|uniref:Amidase domain-containing protein n=1 Tax=Prorocentrum cordatum TaxID=2364126 RepID=A0ABN9TIX5_9DINO|nr:unnamed protein product [Polarella glacialis]
MSTDAEIVKAVAVHMQDRAYMECPRSKDLLSQLFQRSEPMSSTAVDDFAPLELPGDLWDPAQNGANAEFRRHGFRRWSFSHAGEAAARGHPAVSWPWPCGDIFFLFYREAPSGGMASMGKVAGRQLTRGRLTRYEHSLDFPPPGVGRDAGACAEWFREVFYAVPPRPADPSMTCREGFLYSLSAAGYVSERRAGRLTCEEYAAALVKRARYYRYMNQEMDQKAAASGVEAIAPLYGLPVPMKGTAAVVQYPSGAGCGVLSGYAPFAFSYRTANPASGHTRNPYGPKLTVGGSSGGAASAVAAYIRNHFPNAGNPGLTYFADFCDQLGLNARSIEDIILLDAALGESGRPARHEDARRAVAERPASSIRVGAPARPFAVGERLELNPDVRLKLEEAKAALGAAGFAVLGREWPVSGAAMGTRRHQGGAAPGGDGHEGNAIEALLFGSRAVNGEPLSEVLADCGKAGAAHDPGSMFRLACGANETQLRYLMGPWIKESSRKSGMKKSMCGAPRGLFGLAPYLSLPSERSVPGAAPIQESCAEFCTVQFYAAFSSSEECAGVYNSYFDETGADLIVIPSAMAATPDLDALAGAQVPVTPVGGTVGDVKGDENDAFGSINCTLKFLHISPQDGGAHGAHPRWPPHRRPAVGQSGPLRQDVRRQVLGQLGRRIPAPGREVATDVSAAIQGRPGLRRADAAQFAPPAPPRG